MVYKRFQDIELSALGMGTMRLPVINDTYSQIDEPAAAEMLELAFRSGINYFDTAWGYHDGMSETVMGKLLAKYPRESFYLATKFPGYDLSNMTKVQSIFEQQLKKCQVNYFDFYLFHNVCEMNIEGYLNEEYGIFDYLMEQKRNGRIKHLGFSVHGSYEVMKRFLERYSNSMEFCQIQLNYLDWSFQQACAKVELLNSYNIPIWVMEPLRGGKLATLSDKNTNKLNALRPDETIPAWAFRYLQSVKGVTMILSGMSDYNQLKANIETFQTEKPLNETEMSVLLSIADEMLQKKILPCTSCRYCTSHCPQGLDIPSLISLYNEHHFTDGGFLAPMAIMALPDDKKPSACLGCRSCEKVCPQQIKISEALSELANVKM